MAVVCNLKPAKMRDVRLPPSPACCSMRTWPGCRLTEALSPCSAKLAPIGSLVVIPGDELRHGALRL